MVALTKSPTKLYGDQLKINWFFDAVHINKIMTKGFDNLMKSMLEEMGTTGAPGGAQGNQQTPANVAPQPSQQHSDEDVLKLVLTKISSSPDFKKNLENALKQNQQKPAQNQPQQNQAQNQQKPAQNQPQQNQAQNTNAVNKPA